MDILAWGTCRFTSNEWRIGWACSGEKTSTVLISLLCCLLLLVTLQLNEVLIAGVLSLLGEINIYRLQWICYNSCLTAKTCYRHLQSSCFYTCRPQQTFHLYLALKTKKWERDVDGKRWPRILTSYCGLCGSEQLTEKLLDVQHPRNVTLWTNLQVF